MGGQSNSPRESYFTFLILTPFIGLEQHRDYSKELYSLSHMELKLVGLIDNLLRVK